MSIKTQLKPGSELQGGKYRILSVLGQGGFGITYAAEQVALGRRVALKEFFMEEYCNRDGDTSRVSVPSVGSRETVDRFRAKFVKEARMIAGLDHRNIIRIFDVFEENGTAYYVMEYLSGGSLLDLQRSEERLPEDEALACIRQAASALEYIHSMKINHLDIKPGNILLDGKGRAVLIDFGLSKRYNIEGNQTSTTPVGISHGYAPLEQYKTGGVGTFSPATDIYSLGATLYRLLTGQTPPDADVISDEGFPSNPGYISGQVWKAMEAAMQPRRKDRPQSIAEFLKILDGTADIQEDDKTDFDSHCGEDSTCLDDDKAKSAQAGDTHKKKPSQTSSATPRPTTGTHNGHEWVDLGLSVKWATCNVGASAPSDYGNHYAWGEVRTKSEYLESNCTTWEKSMGDIAGDPAHDAARYNWGGRWRLPTKAEWQELVDNCTWIWTKQEGQDGYMVTSKKNGAGIFLPAAGWRNGSSLSDAGEEGNYWSSTPDKSIAQCAISLYFDNGSHDWSYLLRYEGYSVRPVSE